MNQINALHGDEPTKPPRESHSQPPVAPFKSSNSPSKIKTLIIEQTLIQQIIKAINTKYISSHRNPIPEKITPLFPTILDFLQNNYGRITPQQLDNMTTTIKTMIYDPSQPINIIFKSIDNLVEYARAAEAELTQS